MKRAVVAGITAALMTAPLAGCETAPPPPSVEWQKPFDDVEHQWELRGLGNLGTKLVVVVGDETYACGDLDVTGNYTGVAAYCMDSNTIVVADGSFQRLAFDFVKRGGTTQQARYLMFGHELGHRVQHLLLGNQVFPTDKEGELVADCLDGEVLSDMSGDYATKSKEFYDAQGPGLDNGASHGLPEERNQAFLSGLTKDDAGLNYGCGLRSYADGQAGI